MAARPIIAQSPFDDTTANIVLRSCDNVDFYVYKDILKVASPFFHTLFSLPQPTAVPASVLNSTTQDEFSPEGFPIIPVPEESGVLDYILRICYPRPNPEPLSLLALIEAVLIAALKYEIETAIQIARDDFIREGSKSPVQMYTFSCKHNFENEAQTAADLLWLRYHSGGQPNLPSIPTDIDFLRIATEIYHDDCGQLPAMCLYRLLRHICFKDGAPFCDHDVSTVVMAAQSNQGDLPDDESYRDLSAELEGLMSDYPADIFLQASDGVVIPTHKFILRVASATSILSRSEESDCPRRDGIPMIELQHPANILSQLVRACYIPLDPKAYRPQVDDDLRLFHAAECYNMHGISYMAKSRWLSNNAADPLSVYMVASLNGWTEEAKRAVRDVALSGLSISASKVPKMNIAGTSSHYHALLKHINTFNQQLQVVTSHCPSAKYPRGEETWNDPSYACTASIIPIVVFRAMRTLYDVYSIVDPPINDRYQDNFCNNPPSFIRGMVSESEIFRQKHREAILAMDVDLTPILASQ
ncbi:hypothetical protein QCA50_015201 [Cerrena zonata]|uniref:BTB domain-containing protein n=1 Tax=Cerrena zonata TaxID=2478898 RepID=A0AAW0FQK3_9APHY